MLSLLMGTETNLVAYYRFDDEGETAQDGLRSSGSDWVNDWANAATFAGTADFIELGSSSPIGGDTDTDGDGMADWWELTYFGGLQRDGAGDADNDGLRDLYEYYAGTNPLEVDSDNDGLPDIDDDDGDQDGLTNGEEQDLYGTNPGRADTDDDGVKDGAELAGDPNPEDAVPTQGDYLTSPLFSMGHYHPVAAGGAYPFGHQRMLDLAAGETPMGITLPEGTRFDRQGGAWTLEAWVKADTTDADGGPILTYQVNGKTAMAIGLNASYQPYASFQTVSGTTYTAGDSAVTAFTSGSPHHLAGVWDPANHALTLYVDGVLAFSQVVLGAPLSGTGEFFIGGNGATGSESNLDAGALDEVRIWSVARTPDQIEQFRNRLVPTGTAGLLAYYRFDDGGQNIEDFAHAFPAIDATLYDIEYTDYFAPAGNDTDLDATTDWAVLSTFPMLGPTRDFDDTDDDGLPNWFEATFSAGNPTGLAAGDTDADGLTSVTEFLCRTNPSKADTDNDGIPDGQEDFDGDGLANADEQSVGSDPTLDDTDDDGLTDYDEALAGTDPTASLSPLRDRVLERTVVPSCRARACAESD